MTRWTEDGMRFARLGASSDKYGPCEVCGGHAGDVHLRTRDGNRPGPYLFGHLGCLQTAKEPAQ